MVLASVQVETILSFLSNRIPPTIPLHLTYSILLSLPLPVLLPETGMNLALSEGIACIAALVRHFDMTLACPPEEIRREQNFVMKANKMPVRISMR